MNKLWILILSAMFFIPVFGYAEEECNSSLSGDSIGRSGKGVQ